MSHLETKCLANGRDDTVGVHWSGANAMTLWAWLDEQMTRVILGIDLMEDRVVLVHLHVLQSVPMRKSKWLVNHLDIFCDDIRGGS